MQQVISVSEFIGIVNETLSFAFPSVAIEGEVTGYKVWNNRLAFFDLKDENGVINCMLPLGRQKTPLEDGMQVRITAGPKLTKKGRFSVTVSSLELAGEGALRRAFELLKTKLEKEGLFAAERKRPIPQFPKTIGLVTSVESAAYRDFIKIVNDRWRGVEIRVLHVQVQGEAAPAQIVDAIAHFNQLHDPADVLVVTRGGGSLEDLAAFNTEPVARAVAGSRTPTIVGVGHEVDTSLADMVADVRAATPTDAARLVVPDLREVIGQIRHRETLLRKALTQQLQVRGQAIARHIHSLQRQIQLPRAEVERYLHSLLAGSQMALMAGRQQVDTLARTLRSFDPEAVLRRGYAVVRRQGTVVRDASSLSAGDRLMIQLAKGQLDTEVKDVKTD